MDLYDLIIIGGGPTGINCGISAEKAGLKYVIIEKGVLANSVYRFPANMTFFSTSRKLEIGNVPFISHTDKPTRLEALEYYRRLLEAWSLNIKLYEEVTGMTSLPGVGYSIQTDRGHYQASNVVVATGFYDKPRLLKVPGESLAKVTHYYHDAHEYVGQRVLVVGAANSACDVALETYYKGATVTMAIREPEIYPKVKYWIRPNIENRIKEGSIKAYFNTVVKKIEPRAVWLENQTQGLFSLKNDFVLAMTGYQPNYELLNRLGLLVSSKEKDQIPIHNPNTLETPQPGVYVAGVLCAGMKTNQLFIENTRDHGELIIGHILEKRGLQKTG